MTVNLNPYLSFTDNARQAMEYYRSIFGGELNVQTFSELNAVRDESEKDLVMHSQLDGDHGIVFMASDTPASMEYRPGTSFSMSLSGDDEPVLRGYFEKLSSDGTVTMPLEKAIWGDTFGMCVDRFGINWLVNIAGDQQS